MRIDITGINKAEVLKSLYNNSKVQGMGFLSATGKEMTLDEATKTIEEYTRHDGEIYFDYLHGKIMKVTLHENSFNPDMYDRDNGQGAAFVAVKHLDATEIKE